VLLSGPAGAAAATAHTPVSGTAAATTPHNARAAAPGANLLRNGGAETGDASGNGCDAVTIPGWQVASGLPSVIRYGLVHFCSGHRTAAHG
jgi:hypothetical protein